MRKQVTIQVHSDRHPLLFSRFFNEDGAKKPQLKPSQDIPYMAEQFLAGDSQDHNSEVIDRLDHIERLIRDLKTVGVINDDQEIKLKKKASSLINAIPISR